MKIFRVRQATVIKESDSPLRLTVQATGEVASSGWTNPSLEAIDPNPDDAVIEFNFNADRPSGPRSPVITQISASTEVTPDENGLDAVIINGRTNSMTVHASSFVSGSDSQITTQAVGEENQYTTLAIGEENPPVTTYAVGEENSQVTTLVQRGINKVTISML